MIVVENLTKRYGDYLAVENVSFSVKKGEVLGFLGQNGAGKTTVMRMITGYLNPTSGTVSVGGFDVFEHPYEVKKLIGYLPETPPLYDDMTVTSYLNFVSKMKGVTHADRNERIEWVVEKCNLKDVTKRLIQNLSKGYRQRLGLAGALVHKPPVLIFDEPTVGLDPKQINEIRELIVSLKGDHLIILSSHILPEVTVTCDRAIVIDRGHVIADKKVKDLTGEQTLEHVFLELIAKESLS